MPPEPRDPMNTRQRLGWYLLVLTGLGATPLLATQPMADDGKEPDKKEFGKKDFFFGGPPGGPTRKLVAQFDKDGDGRLNAAERKAARASLKKDGGGGKGGFKFGGKGGKGG